MTTRYFGEYVEKTNNPIQVKEYVGKVKAYTLNNEPAAYLYCTVDGEKTRFDLPRTFITYANYKVSVLGRAFVKTVGDKSYNKLVVVALKRLPYEH